jgi:hypothetical protein
MRLSASLIFLTLSPLAAHNSDPLKADDRVNPVELRRDPCPKCKSVGPLVLKVFGECGCPKCHGGVLKKIDVWIR